jgi:hypothetical protein
MVVLGHTVREEEENMKASKRVAGKHGPGNHLGYQIGREQPQHGYNFCSQVRIFESADPLSILKNA